MNLVQVQKWSCALEKTNSSRSGLGYSLAFVKFIAFSLDDGNLGFSPFWWIGNFYPRSPHACYFSWSPGLLAPVVAPVARVNLWFERVMAILALVNLCW